VDIIKNLQEVNLCGMSMTTYKKDWKIIWNKIMKKTTVQSDWRYTTKELEKRAFLITTFVHNGYNISAQLYEFCDYCISQGITWPTPADEFLMKEFEKYKHLYS